MRLVSDNVSDPETIADELLQTNVLTALESMTIADVRRLVREIEATSERASAAKAMDREGLLLGRTVTTFPISE